MSAITKYSVNHNFFDEINTEEKAWCLGIMASDGHVCSDREAIYLQMTDEDVVIKFRECLESNNPISKHKIQKDRLQTYALRISSKRIFLSLNELGVTRRKTLTAVFPDSIDESLYRHFIRGVFDGDGSISITDKYKKAMICGTESMITGIYNRFTENNIIGYTSRDKRSDNLYSVLVGVKMFDKLYDYMYKDATVYMNRKYIKFKNYIS